MHFIKTNKIKLKVFFILLVLILVCFSFISDKTYAASTKASGLLSKNCASCHNNKGDASPFSPARFSSSQWQRFFDRNKHDRVRKLEPIPQEELIVIIEYLKGHAADSDDPVGKPIK